MGIGDAGIGAAASLLTKIVPFYARFSRDTWTATGDAVAEIFNTADAAVRALREGESPRKVLEDLPSEERRTHYARVFSRAVDERVVAGAKGRTLLAFVQSGMEFTWQQLLLLSFDGSHEDLKRIQDLAAERERAQARLATLSGLRAYDEHAQLFSVDGDDNGRIAAPDPSAWSTSPIAPKILVADRIRELQQHMSACGELMRYLDGRERYAR